MSESVGALRRAAANVLGVPDVARVARWLTRAIDREQADAQAEHEAGAHRLPLESRLRLATFFSLACGVLFLPVEGSHVRGTVFGALLLLYGMHAVLTSTILIASFTARGARHADALALALVVGHAVNLHAYLYVWPKHPGLPAGILACLLVGNAVLFSWGTGRVLGLALAICTTFPLVGLAAGPHGLQRPDFAVATVVLAVGAATAVGSARLLALLRASLAQRQRELRELSARLMAAQEDERRRLARDLHDEFGQALTAVNATLWLIERQPPDADTVRARTAEARRLIKRTIGAMRELSQLLRPPLLDALGLLPSLESLIEEFGKRHGIVSILTSDPLPQRLPVEVETALYRIAQEALTNVARHARARHVRVALAVFGGEIRVEVEDDGVGLPERDRAAAGGAGLIGIRERVRALGGQLTITSHKGLCLSVQVPLGGSSC